MGTIPRRLFTIRIPIGIALSLAVVLLSVVPIFFLQGLISHSAQDTVEGQVLRLTQGIFNNARYVLNNSIHDLVVMSRVDTDRTELLVKLSAAADGQPILVPHFVKRRMDSLGKILFIPLIPGKPISSLNLESEASTVDWDKTYQVRLLPALVHFESDTLALLREYPGRILCLGQLPFLPEMQSGFWVVSKMELPGGEKAVLCLSLKQKLVADFLRRMAHDTNANVHLICSDNTILPKDDIDFFSQSFASRALNRANEGSFSFFRSSLQNDGQALDVLVHVYADPQYLYNILATTPRAALTAALRQAIDQTRWVITVIGLFMLVCGIFVVWLVGRRVATLRRIMEQIAGGYFSFIPREPLVSIMEVEQIHDGIVSTGQQLSQALDVLGKNQQDLEASVAARTADLEKALADQIKLQDFIIQNEKMASLGRTVAGFTHELNTPLGVSYTASTQFEQILHTLRHNFESNTLSQRVFQESIDRLTQAAELIIRNLQEANRISASYKHLASDQSHVELRDYVLGDYLAEVISSLSPKLRSHKVSLESACTLVIHGDPAPFYQIFANLINNSVDHGFRNGISGLIEIRLALETSPVTNIVIHYHDNGVGMDEQQLARIYEPYFTTGQAYGGTGLGMGIVKNLVEKELGGSIECSSSPGQGVTFTLRFPHGGACA